MIEERKENQVKHMPYVCEFSNIPALPWMASNEGTAWPSLEFAGLPW